jgi:hypothetical protein
LLLFNSNVYCIVAAIIKLNVTDAKLHQKHCCLYHNNHLSAAKKEAISLISAIVYLGYHHG